MTTTTKTKTTTQEVVSVLRTAGFESFKCTKRERRNGFTVRKFNSLAVGVLCTSGGQDLTQEYAKALEAAGYKVQAVGSGLGVCK